ncbi:hypothetical protein RRG08_061593 [Elysia crispata]|uniref:Uncharacterized protein n=1 Tax=Elysia crispata TaxID=231223 RepID=A0AAE0YSR7_9GAST|nr:hypothetical protein RRG08_061593 [Elysia crispata]
MNGCKTAQYSINSATAQSLPNLGPDPLILSCCSELSVGFASCLRHVIRSTNIPHDKTPLIFNNKFRDTLPVGNKKTVTSPTYQTSPRQAVPSWAKLESERYLQ